MPEQQLINKDEVKNILISRTDRLGDVILTLPLITETKKIFKDAKIYFLTKKYCEDILKNYEGIDELLIEEDIPYCLNKYEYLEDKKIDLVISVKPRFDLAFLFYMLGIKYSIGTGYRWYSFLYNCKVYEHRKISDKHESDYNINLLKTFFDEVSIEKKFYFKYTDEEKEELAKKLSEFDLSLKENYIIIHPGSGGSAADLPAETLTAYLNLFIKDFPNYKIIFTGLEEEKILVDKIKTGVLDKNKVTDLTGKLNLRELLILTDNCKLFVSNSTGPIHIAGALNKNIIGFYPNEPAMSDTRWGPLSKDKIILKPEGKSNDMTDIRAANILIATKKFLD